MLRVGVIGLGRLWRERYRPALLALHDRFEVGGVCDQVRERANREARALHCEAFAGPTVLLENQEIEAVLLLDEQWFGLWPLQAACRTGKPVFCCGSLECEGGRADDLVRQVRERRLPVMTEMALRHAPAAGRLRELLAAGLGPARLLRCDLTYRQDGGPEAGTADGRRDLVLGTREGIAVLDCCASLLGSGPADVTAVGPGPAGFTSLFLRFRDGRALQVNSRHVPHGRPAVRLEVVAEHGVAVLDFPERVRWTAADGLHAQVLRPGRPTGQTLLDQFHDAVTSARTPEPNLEDGYRMLTWLRAAARSCEEGRRVDLDE